MSKLSEAKEAYTFDDFVLVPNYSDIKSRKIPETNFVNSKYAQRLPIIASPMNTITEEAMIDAMLNIGAQAVLHRYLSIENQIEKCKLVDKTYFVNGKAEFFVAIGATGDYFERAQALFEIGINKFCIDVANGYSQTCVDAIKKIKNSFDCLLMAGNVCDYDAALKLAQEGADLIRVGIGPSSVCSTRVITGHGIPQLSAIEECAKVKDIFPNIIIVADGGIRGSGDLVKAIAIGADLCMLGTLLSATNETPGEVFLENGKNYKMFNGMASLEGRNSWFGSEKSSFVPEGVSSKSEYKNKSVKDVVEELISGLKVGMSYAGAYTLNQLKQKAQWRKITLSGAVEGTPYAKKKEKI